MRPIDSIRFDDASRVLQLVSECIEMQKQRLSWQAHLTTRLEQEIASYCTSFMRQPIRAGALAVDAVEGRTEAHFAPNSDASVRRALERYLIDGGLRLLPPSCVWHRLGAEPAVRVLAFDRSRTRFYQEYLRPVRVGQMLNAVWKVDREAFCLSICRESRDRPFTEQDVAFMQFTIAVLGGPLGKELAAPAKFLLPPRLQQVLNGILGGKSEKEISAHLGLAPSTVHEYVGTVYRRFGVRSRGELMAHFVRDRPASDERGARPFACTPRSSPSLSNPRSCR